MQSIILLRHAEKPGADGRVGGVDADGRADGHELSVRGWQRAGALARFFARGGGDLGVPDVLVAGPPSAAHPSRRSVSTLRPLAERLGLRLELDFPRGQEAALARELQHRDGGLALVAWDHHGLVEIARALRPHGADLPASWDEDCFDRFWIFSREEAGWRFQPRAQRLLAGDAEA